MTTKINKSVKRKRVSPSTLLKMKKARQDYLKIWKDVEPFVRKRNITMPSTIGKWLSFNYEP